MMSLSLIVFREIIEISLILSIVMVASKNLKNRHYSLISGVILGVLGSFVIAMTVDYISELVEGVGEEIFNAMLLFITAFFILFMLVYTSKYCKDIKHTLSNRTSFFGILMVVAFTIFREGSEIVLITYSYSLTDIPLNHIILGLMIGISSGLAIGMMIYASTSIISPKKIFPIINWILIFVVAGFISQGVNYLVAADIIGIFTQVAWDISSIIANDGIIGTILHALFGYTSNPTVIQIIAYLFSLIFAVMTYKGRFFYKSRYC